MQWRDPIKGIQTLILLACVLLTGTPTTWANCASGPDACIHGFVWREAFPNDHVCVTGTVRQQALDDNAAASSRRSPTGGVFGPDTCKQGFVWREASANDRVCTTGAVRAQASADNRKASSRIALQCAAAGAWCGAKNLVPPEQWDCPGGTSCGPVRKGPLQTVDWYCVGTSNSCVPTTTCVQDPATADPRCKVCRTDNCDGTASVSHTC